MFRLLRSSTDSLLTIRAYPGHANERDARKMQSEASSMGPNLTTMPFTDLIAAAEHQSADTQIALYHAWIAANPASPHAFAAWFNLGVAKSHAGQQEAAAQAYSTSLALRPHFHAASLNLGLALERLGRPDAALKNWREALQPESERIALLNQQARLLEKLGRLEEAEGILRTSLLTNPAQQDAVQHWVHIRQKSCTWPVLAPLPGLDESMLRRGAGPLAALALTDDIAEQQQAAKAWIQAKTSLPPRHLSPAGGYNHSKVRVGYMSSDFCRHAMSYLVVELFEQHDRANFEVYGYCSSPEDGSALRSRVLSAFDHIRPIGHLDDAAAAQTIRDDEIDILIDLNGLTSGARMQVLRWRPAPVQATYLGFVGPVPLPELDYILCDDTVIPPRLASQYSPVPLSVGPLYQANDTQRGIGAVPARSSLGLPENGFVFCCFSNHYKITSSIFEAWMRILRAAPTAVLWLAADTKVARENMVGAAIAAGVSPEQLIFAERCDPDVYMGRLAAADLFLDTFPYNAGTIASDSLRMGLPLISLGGEAFASRMATSLLRAIGAEDCAVTSLADYEALAIALATDPARYSACKRRFSAEAWRNTVGDVQQFTRNFEAALLSVVRSPA